MQPAGEGIQRDCELRDALAAPRARLVRRPAAHRQAYEDQDRIVAAAAPAVGHVPDVGLARLDGRRVLGGAGVDVPREPPGADVEGAGRDRGQPAPQAVVTLPPTMATSSATSGGEVAQNALGETSGIHVRRLTVPSAPSNPGRIVPVSAPVAIRPMSRAGRKMRRGQPARTGKGSVGTSSRAIGFGSPGTAMLATTCRDTPAAAAVARSGRPEPAYPPRLAPVTFQP